MDMSMARPECSMTSDFKAGSVQNYVYAWKQITDNSVVIDWLQNGVQIPFQKLPEQFTFPNPPLGKKECCFISSELVKLEASGAIERCDFVPHCVSPIHCVPKKNKEYRLIVNLKHLNSCCEVPKFRYDDINTVLDLVKPGDNIVTVDIKNGFYHIPVHKDCQKYLGIFWNGNYYIWKVLPFGLSASPYFFNKCIRPIVDYLRSKGI